jgi:hypothetical protein
MSSNRRQAIKFAYKLTDTAISSAAIHTQGDEKDDLFVIIGLIIYTGLKL